MKTSVFSNLVIDQLSRILQITCSHVFIADVAMAEARYFPGLHLLLVQFFQGYLSRRIG